MRTEADFSSYIQRRLIAQGIDAHLEGNIPDIEILAALNNASKNFKENTGYPDILAVVKDFVLVMESKSDYLKLEKKDGTNFADDKKSIQDYAVNGAIFYARKIFEGTHYTKIFAFGNAGDKVHHNFKPVFIGEGKDKKRVIKEFKSVEVFENFNEENIDAYYQQEILGEELPEDKELKKVIKYAENLHERLRNYGQLGETEKPLVVSGIILAMDDGLTLDELKGNISENETVKEKSSETSTAKIENAESQENHKHILNDGEIIFNHIVNRLKTAQVQPEVKKERVLAQFRLIKNRPLLNAVHSKLNKTPLKYFAEYIQNNIYAEIKKSGSTDYLGIFYREFIKYSGGDGQTLGVVLTPKHITELFCDLVDLNVNDVVFDPCCGTGGFLIAAMNYMLELVKHDEKLSNEIKAKQLHGVEVRDDMFSIATTSMILRGDGKSNLICDNFFDKKPEDFFVTDEKGEKQPVKFTVGFMNPPYSQSKNDATKHLSELRFIEHLLNSVTEGGRVAVIVPVSAMIGKTSDDKKLKREILKHHTLKGVISLNKNTFYQVGTVPCIAVFKAGRPHKPGDFVKFINWEDDGYELRKHEGYKKTSNFKERRKYLLECWRGNNSDAPSSFMVETKIEPDDEWLHSFYYYNDEKPAEEDFINTIADYLTFEFNMITHGRGYLFDGAKKNFSVTENLPPLENKIWQTFLISDLFEFEAGKCSQANQLKSFQNGIPYIGATNRNNGVLDFVEPVEKLISRGNAIAFVCDGEGSMGYSFYKAENSIATTNIIFGYSPKLNRRIAFFITTVADKVRGKYSYNYKRRFLRLQKEKLLLPVNELGEPDFEYMEKYIALREQKLIQQYLDRICPPNVAEIVPLENKIWQEFFIEDIFEIKPGKRLTKNDMTQGEIPFIGASDSNNGITQFVGNENISADENVLGVNYNGSVVENFYHPYRCLFSDDVKRFKLKNFDGNQYIYLFLKSILLQKKIKYTYGYKFNESRMRKQKILLPVNETGAPDFEYMEAYSKNLFAQVLKRYLEVTQ